MMFWFLLLAEQSRELWHVDILKPISNAHHICCIHSRVYDCEEKPVHLFLVHVHCAFW